MWVQNRELSKRTVGMYTLAEQWLLKAREGRLEEEANKGSRTCFPATTTPGTIVPGRSIASHRNPFFYRQRALLHVTLKDTRSA